MKNMQFLTVLLFLADLIGKVILYEQTACFGPKSKNCRLSTYYDLINGHTLTFETAKGPVVIGKYVTNVVLRETGQDAICANCFMMVDIEFSPQPLPATLQLSETNFTGDNDYGNLEKRVVPLATYSPKETDYPTSLNTSGTALHIVFTNQKEFEGRLKIVITPYVTDQPPESSVVVIGVIIMVTIVTALISGIVICSIKLLRRRAARNSVRMVVLVNEN